MLFSIEDAPEGAICEDCPKPLNTYNKYGERPYGMIGDIPIVDLLCLDCAVSA